LVFLDFCIEWLSLHTKIGLISRSSNLSESCTSDLNETHMPRWLSTADDLTKLKYNAMIKIPSISWISSHTLHFLQSYKLLWCQETQLIVATLYVTQFQSQRLAIVTFSVLMQEFTFTTALGLNLGYHNIKLDADAESYIRLYHYEKNINTSNDPWVSRFPGSWHFSKCHVQWQTHLRYGICKEQLAILIIC
jgi:hypothetical protein